MQSRLRLLVLPVLLLGLATAFVSACGSSSSSSKDATDLVNKAFRQPIKSADVSFNLELQVNGVASLKNPVSFKFAGPYVNNGPGRLPSLDLNASIVGGGQSVPFGITSTGDDFFVKVQGTSYEVGKSAVAKINQQLASQAGKGQKTSLSELGVHPLSWLSNAKTEGDSTVGGQAVTHVAASLDVTKVLNDLNQVVAKAPSTGTTGVKPPKLTDQQKSQVESAIKDPHIDVYVAKSDNTVRRLATTLDISVPKDQQKNFNGATGGTLQISIDFANVGAAKTIQAPANAKPISQLTQQLQSPLTQTPGTGGSGSTGSGSTPGTGATGGTPSAKQFQQYAQCLQKAGNNDAAAIQKCAAILK